MAICIWLRVKAVVGFASCSQHNSCHRVHEMQPAFRLSQGANNEQSTDSNNQRSHSRSQGGKLSDGPKTQFEKKMYLLTWSCFSRCESCSGCIYIEGNFSCTATAYERLEPCFRLQRFCSKVVLLHCSFVFNSLPSSCPGVET